MSGSTTTGNLPASAAACRRGDDFPSWMSPMLVKELRQGVQSGGFAWTFVLLQAGMFVLMTTWLVNRAGKPDAPTADGQFYHGLFWVLFTVAASLVVPARAAASMAAERQGMSLDLLRLTRLSSTQIVLGKWLGTMAQVLLLAVAVLPYVVLQYFFGGFDLVADLVTFVLVLLAAAVTTAASVSLARQAGLVRLGILLLLAYAAVVLVAGGVGVAGSGMVAWWGIVPVAALAALFTAVLLEYAAADIAPAAENHAGRIRVLTLLAVALTLATRPLRGPGLGDVLVTVVALVTMAVASAEFTTDPPPIRSILAPFARAGLPGRLAAFLFTPGWATAVPFFLVAMVPWLSLTTMAAGPTESRSLVGLLAAAVAAVLLPLPLMVLFPPGRRRWTALLAVDVASIALFVIAAASDPTTRVDVRVFVSLLPLPALFHHVAGGPSIDVSVLPALAITVLCLITLLPRWIGAMRNLGAGLGALRARPPEPRRPRDGA